jgi:hypothetical protein
VQTNLSAVKDELKRQLPDVEQVRVDNMEGKLNAAEMVLSQAGHSRETRQRHLHEAFRACLEVLWFYWPSRALEACYGIPAPNADSPGPLKAWVQSTEEFLAMETTRYVSHFFVHLRNLVNALILGTLLLLLTLTLYPFQPQGLLLVYVVVQLVAVGVAVMWLLVGVNRNELMSRLAGSTPNRFTPDLNFYQATAQYILPVVGLLMVQFPVVGSYIRSILEPLLRIIR